jgi:enoyl-CoA hydratase/carnithine racemase
MPYQNIVPTLRGPIATIMLNRPEQMNPLDWSTVRELKRCLTEVEENPAIRVIVITGEGRAFSAGGDLKGYLTLYKRPNDFGQFLRDLWEVCDRIERSAKVVIAAVNGYCLAGGIELMLACDLVVASEDARIGDAHLNFGQLPGGGGSQRLPRTIGTLRAKQFFFTGEWVNGAEAERIGLVNKAVPPGQLAAAVDALVQKILAKSPAGLKGIKYLVNEGMEMNLRAGLELELSYVHSYATSCEDAMEGLMAFDQKRKPHYR